MKKIKLTKKQVLLYLLLFITVFFIGKQIFKTDPKKIKLKEANFEYSKVTKRDIKSIVTASGAINPVNVVSVGAQVSGIVDKIYVDYNDAVKAGQLLAEIDKSLLNEDINSAGAKLTQAKAKFDLAKLNKQRTEELFNSGYIALIELDQAETELASTESDYISALSNFERSQINLKYARISSPVSGVVISKDVEEGQTIASSFSAPTLFKIAEDLSKMQIEASISEADIGNIKKGQTVDFTVDAFPLETFTGSVDQIRLNPTTDQNVVIYNVIIKIDNKDGKLLPGMTAFVEINTLEKNNTFAVDNSTLQFRPDENLRARITYPQNSKIQIGEGYVYTLNVALGTINPIKIKKGITDGTYTEINYDNIKEGDKLIMDFLTDKESKAKKTNTNRSPSGPRH